MRPTPRLPLPLRPPLLSLLCLLGAGGVHAQGTAAPPLPALLGPNSVMGPEWRVVGLPARQRNVPLTAFDPGQVDGHEGVRVSTDASYGTLVHTLPGNVLPVMRLAWRWRLDQPLVGGSAAPDIMSRGGDDAALKVCALFDHPLDRVPFMDRQMLRLARSVSGEDLPAATVCYVWDSTYQAPVQAANPYTRRVRFITLQGRSAPLSRWITESRDVGRDFLALFGEEQSQDAPLPRLTRIVIGGDSDNTGSRSLGWVADLRWQPAEAR
ncbi:DUF3047 domain-containing protein [uncultured Hydrogenophaga sp.]|uniref:DUF3047 domain-containing protein n=1 Tax=uncultured Hydrogenophaga sp. TaxID=199683 RepID=UPI0026604E0E|nr:DUF3047 domain-containing protein [uncultured Hydrogenophaga sp.]